MSAAAPAGLPCAGNGAWHQYASVLGGRRRRSLARWRQVARMDPAGGDGWRSVRGGSRGTRQRYSTPAFYRKGRAGRGRLQVHWAQDVRQLGTSLDSLWTARLVGERRGRAKG